MAGMRMSILAAVLCLAPALPAAAQDAGQQPAAPEKKICRYYAETGSILPGKRECHTASEWREIDARNRAYAEHVINSSRDGNQRIGPGG